MQTLFSYLGVSALALAAVSSVSMAAITVDGTLDAGYGSALAVQTNNTQFGDSTGSTSVTAGGSELDAAYGVISGGYLNLLFTGNLQNGGNRLNVFISSGAANGQSTLAATGTLANYNGAKFSSGFTANYALDVNLSGGTGFVDQYTLSTVGGGSSNQYVGSFVAGSGTTGTITPFTTTSLLAASDNSNNAGVDGSAPSAANATNSAAVTTGIEIAIPLSDLGYTSGNIRVLADINSGSDNFASNQFLTGLNTVTGNLGGTPFDFSGTSGQFFTVVPEPASLSLLGLGGLAMLRRRK